MTIVPVSNWLENIVKQSFLSAHPIQVINNGIDTFVFKPWKSNHIKNKYNLLGKFVILGVAIPWSKRKGFYDFIELSKHLDSNFKILLIGLTQKQINKLPPNIIGITKTNNIKELAKFYSCADIFLNPTWEDNFPTTNIESLACGTPVLTTKISSMPEEYHDYVYFIENESVEGITKTIEEVLKKPKKELFEMGQKAKKFVLREKNNIVQARKIVDLITNNK